VIKEVEKITIVLDLIDRTKAGFRNVSDRLNLFRKSTQQADIGLAAFRSSWQKWQTQVATPTPTILGRIQNRFRELTTGMGRFRFEMLSVMFFGMAINRMFMGMLQPAMQAAGVFEIFSAILELAFLPVALMVLDPLLGFMDWFLGLPEPVQTAIGVLFLFLGVIGMILTTIGVLVLGLEGLAMAFGPLLGASAAGATGMGAFSGASLLLGKIIGGIIGTFKFLASLLTGPVIAAIVLLYGAWVHNAEGISRAVGKLWNTIQSIFGNIIGVIQGFIDLFTALVEGDATKAFEALRNIGKHTVGAIIDAFVGLPTALFDVFWQIEYGIGKFVVNIVKTVFELGVKIMDALARGIASAYGHVKEALRRIPVIGPLIVGGMEAGETIVGAVGGVLQTVGTQVGGLFRGLFGGLFGFQYGGIVTKPTLALVGERGPEAIVPLGSPAAATTTISPTYIINATVSSDIDIRALAEKLNDLLVSDYRRLTYR